MMAVAWGRATDVKGAKETKALRPTQRARHHSQQRRLSKLRKKLPAKHELRSTEEYLQVHISVGISRPLASMR